jgi:Leucine-rich repeat (LRR) protein
MDNILIELPASFVELSALESLLIMENKLSSFPKDMNRLTSIEYINVYGNDFSEETIEKLRMLLPNCEISIDDI